MTAMSDRPLSDETRANLDEMRRMLDERQQRMEVQYPSLAGFHFPPDDDDDDEPDEDEGQG